MRRLLLSTLVVVTACSAAGGGADASDAMDETCAAAWEGAGNGGSACGTAHDVKIVCPAP